MKNWKITGESYGNYIAVGDGTKTVARIPWGDGDNESAHLIESAPAMYKALKRIEDRLAMLDAKVNAAGDKQIADAWSMANEIINQIKPHIES